MQKNQYGDIIFDNIMVQEAIEMFENPDNKILQDKELYKACIEELYSSNEAYRQSIAGKDFSYLFIEDILFYQRPLKTKKTNHLNLEIN